MLGYYIVAIAGAVFGAVMICILIGGGKDIERVTRCKDCADRWTCQIRIQCMEDEDDFCSLGTREE